MIEGRAPLASLLPDQLGFPALATGRHLDDSGPESPAENVRVPRNVRARTIDTVARAGRHERRGTPQSRWKTSTMLAHHSPSTRLSKGLCKGVHTFHHSTMAGSFSMPALS